MGEGGAAKENFDDVTEQHRQEERGNFEKYVVYILKRKEQMVRNIAEKNRCLVVFGDIENNNL